MSSKLNDLSVTSMQGLIFNQFRKGRGARNSARGGSKIYQVLVDHSKKYMCSRIHATLSIFFGDKKIYVAFLTDFKILLIKKGISLFFDPDSVLVMV